MGFSPVLVCQIVCFLRIFLQVEEMFATGLGVPDVLVVSVCHIVVAVIVVVTPRMFTVETISDPIGVALHNR